MSSPAPALLPIADLGQVDHGSHAIFMIDCPRADAVI